MSTLIGEIQSRNPKYGGPTDEFNVGISIFTNKRCGYGSEALKLMATCRHQSGRHQEKLYVL
jgi:hypothetical protein